MKFKEIFQGNQGAYGVMRLTGKTTEKGKAIAKAFIERHPVTDKLWEEHIAGKDPALGIIPINENNKCKWGCIDVDIYNLDHLSIMREIKGHGFPLVTFRSKSGGAHLFLFSKEFIPASLMQSKLKAMAEVLGYGDSEIFPKQTEIIAERGDVGNFLNLPYHGGIRGMRYTFEAGGKAASLESFYSIYDEWAQTKEQIEKIIIKAKEKTKEILPDGPPCLNKLARDGFGEGSRNNALFNLAIYRQKANPDNWQDKLMEDNQNYMNPPLGYQEVQNLIKSIGKKGYDKYRCREQPIEPHCQPGLCSKCKFGVGYGEEQMPELSNLTKVNSSPPQWFLDVEDRRIELKTEQLHNPNLFALAVLDQANIVSPIPRAKDWRKDYIQPLINSDKFQELKPLDSLNPETHLINLLRDFTVNRTAARKKGDILSKMAWTDEEGKYCYFRMDDLYAFMKRNNWELDRTKTGNLLKGLKNTFVKESRMPLETNKGVVTPHVIKIKVLKKEEATISEVTYEETPF